MSYTSSGGTKGLGVFGDTAQTVSDLNQLITLIARVGNLRVETESARDAISGSALYEGLHLYNLDTHQLEYYDGSGWEPVLRSEVVSLVSDVSSGFDPTGTAGTPFEPRMYVTGRRVQLAGAVTRNALSTMGDLMTIPSPYRPARSGLHFIGFTIASVASGSTAAGIELALDTSTGKILVPVGYETKSPQSGVAVPLDGCGWFLD